ncbi:MAG TPA: hypothetical protein PKA64_22390, partial [Myxococcota bacterium]|nr:hypothetical protein [Myxococcota bacterium]
AGIRVGAGESLIVQVHWSAGAGAVEPPEVRLQWADEPPAREARLLLLGNASDATEGLLPDPADVGEPEFRIPAGSPEHAEVMVVPVARGGPPARLFAVGHHMHRFGWRMTSRVVGGPCLLDTPDWRYEWHTLYHVDAPEPAWLEVRPDDRVELRCVYRNTLDHPGAAATYQAAGVDQPVDVGLGAGSLDEMCNLLLGVVEEEAPAP